MNYNHEFRFWRALLYLVSVWTLCCVGSRLGLSVGCSGSARLVLEGSRQMGDLEHNEERVRECFRKEEEE